MKIKHPYQKYESFEAWKVLDKAVTALRKNRDLEETAARPYVVGYLVKQLAESGLIAGSTDQKARRPSRKVVSKIVLLRPFRKRFRAKSLL